MDQAGTGITSGLDKPRKQYAKKVRSLGYAKQQLILHKGFNKFGLNLLSTLH